MARSAEKSTFAVTCSLLSQYIKHKGGIAPLPHETPKGDTETHRTPTTMCLLPGVDVTAAEEEGEGEGNCSRGKEMELFPQRSGFSPSDGDRQSSDAGMIQRGQLTIFYGGKVLVFDNFPPEKAKDLMHMVTKGIAGALAPTAAVEAAHVPSVQRSTATPGPPIKLLGAPVLNAQKGAHPTVSDMPIARKASLHRFLEKRKDRLNANAPYRVSPSPAAALVKQEESRSWLGLDRQSPKPSLSLSLERSQ